MNDFQPSYYAVIPANVRYCKNLEPNAKLLYGEITALCNKEGFCWAKNSYFAELYDVDNRTVQRWLLSLQKAGFIHIEIEENGFNPKRLIYLSQTFQIISTVRQKCHGGGDKNVILAHNTKNNTSKYPPPSPPPKSEPKKNPKKEEEDFLTFEILKNTILSPQDQRRLSKEFTLEEVERALKISKTQTIKKSLMSLLLNILQNPTKWSEKVDVKPLTPQQQKAIEYNQKLAKIKPKLSKRNEVLIENGYLVVSLGGGIIQLSLKAHDFLDDINKALKEIEQ